MGSTKRANPAPVTALPSASPYSTTGTGPPIVTHSSTRMVRSARMASRASTSAFPKSRNKVRPDQSCQLPVKLLSDSAAGSTAAFRSGYGSGTTGAGAGGGGGATPGGRSRGSGLTPTASGAPGDAGLKAGRAKEAGVGPEGGRNWPAAGREPNATSPAIKRVVRTRNPSRRHDRSHR